MGEDVLRENIQNVVFCRNPVHYVGAAWIEGQWRPVVLRLLSYCVECFCQSTSKTLWRIEICHLLRPAVRILKSSERTHDPPQPFAFHTKTSKMPFVCATEERDGFIQTLQKTASERLGILIDRKTFPFETFRYVCF